MSGIVDFTTVGYATTSGAQLWARSYQPPAAVNGTDGAQAAGMSPDGASVYITGSAAGSARNSVTYTTIAYHTATGQKAWLARYVGPRHFDFANALAVSPTGQGVFVTGFIGVHDGCCNFGTVPTSRSVLSPSSTRHVVAETGYPVYQALGFE